MVEEEGPCVRWRGRLRILNISWETERRPYEKQVKESQSVS